MTEVLGFIGLALLGVIVFALICAGLWIWFLKSLPLMARETRKAIREIDKGLEGKKK